MIPLFAGSKAASGEAGR